MALKIIKTSDLEEILTCNDESFLTITQKISEDNFISNKMQIKNLPLNNYYKKTAIDELLKTYSKTTHNHDFNSLSNLPTTLSGYGITDVYTKTEIQDNTLNKIKATSGKMLVDTGFSLGVKDGDNLIEIETEENENLDNIEILIRKVNEIDIPIYKDNYFVKKAEIELNKVLNRNEK